MEFEELLNDHFKDLNGTDKYIARWLLQNRKKMANTTIANVAKSCSVSQASVFRFSKKLDLGGFSELKYLISQTNTPVMKGKGSVKNLV